MLDAASKEKTVTLYHSNPNTANVIFWFERKYGSKYGIHVETFKAIAADLVSRVEAERTSKQPAGDVLVINDTNYFKTLQTANNLVKLDTLPCAALWKDNATYFHGFVAETEITPLVVAWNTKLVPNGIKSYADLADKKLGGLIGYATITADTYKGWFKWLEGTQPTILQTLKDQNARAYDSSAPLIQGLAAGEVAVAINTTPSIAAGMVAKGAPIAYALFDKSFAVSVSTTVLSFAKHPNAALVLANYMMSPEGQALLCPTGTGCVSPLASVNQTPADMKRIDKIFDISEWPADAKAAYTTHFNSILGG
ncbi:MAG: extracellular solute-binding protein [Actinomycetota bacterium]